MKTAAKLQPGYAMVSSRKYPREPETVVISQEECDRAVFQGQALIDNDLRYGRWKIRGKRRYYFQLCWR